jgi:hypothetical protein
LTVSSCREPFDTRIEPIDPVPHRRSFGEWDLGRDLSIGVQSGPPIGAQKGPPWVCVDRLMLGAGFVLLPA